MHSFLRGQFVGSMDFADQVMNDGKVKKAYKQVDILNQSPLYGNKVINVKYPAGFNLTHKIGEKVEIPVESSGWGNEKKSGQSVVYAPLS